MTRSACLLALEPNQKLWMNHLKRVWARREVAVPLGWQQAPAAEWTHARDAVDARRVLVSPAYAFYNID